jgi:uncharacterized damage-inducible protein DinB
MRPAGLKDGKPSRLRDEELGIIGDRKKGRLEQTGAPRGFVKEESSMNQTDMLLLYEYNAWADRRVLEAASALTPEQYNKQMGSSFSSVRDTLSHIYGVEWLWLERFQGRSPSAIPDDAAYADITKLKQSWERFEPTLLTFVRGLSQEKLDTVFEYKTMKFGIYRNPLWQSMQHLVNHGTYHRGQITTMLRQLGAQPILTDLMHFYREHAAAAGA